METPLEEEVRRLKILLIRFSAEIDRKNKKMKYMGKMLEERSMSLSRMTEERDHLYQAFSEERSTLMRELETQRKEIEQQAKEIEKLDAQLDFKSKQLLVLSKLNTVKGKPKKVKNVGSLDKVQVQIDTNGVHKEPKEKDYELDSELYPKQTLVDKEHRSDHDLQEACKVSLEEVKKEEDEELIELADEWGKGDIGGCGVECNAFQDMYPPIPPSESLVDPCNELPVPNDEIAELEGLSNFVEKPLLTGGITPLRVRFFCSSQKDDSRRFCTSNPVSVLENSSSCSGAKTMPLSPDTPVPVRVRSKRPRPTVFIQRPAPNLVSHTPCITNFQNLSVSNSYMSSESENVSEYHPPHTPKSNDKEQKKKKKMKKRLPPSLPSYSSDHDNRLQQQQRQPGLAVQNCLHCGITETTQWREGPMGPRTLCNACGLRYKSGRLFPEYRPAASPTFVASIHSNSHRRVLEMMRVKDTSLQMS